MTNGIRNGMADDKGNSLSPEPCALIPVAQFASHSQLVGARVAAAETSNSAMRCGGIR